VGLAAVLRPAWLVTRTMVVAEAASVGSTLCHSPLAGLSSVSFAPARPWWCEARRRYADSRDGRTF
jgi:hypothetical protein